MRFALIPPPDPYPLSLTLSKCAKPCRASIPTGLCRQQEKMNWAKNPFWRKIIFAQLKIIQGRRSPIQIKCRQAFALLKGVCGSKGMGPLPRVSKPWKNKILSEKERPRYTVSHAFKKSLTTTERPFSLSRKYWMKRRCDRTGSTVLQKVSHRKTRTIGVRRKNHRILLPSLSCPSSLTTIFPFSLKIHPSSSNSFKYRYKLRMGMAKRSARSSLFRGSVAGKGALVFL